MADAASRAFMEKIIEFSGNIGKTRLTTGDFRKKV